MSISHCYCSDYMTKPTQFGDEPKISTADITERVTSVVMCLKYYVS